MILREFSENMKVIALQITPISVVSLFFIGGIIVGSYMGMEAVVRLNTLVIPIIIIGSAIILVGSANYFDTANIMPILGSGPVPILQKSFMRLAVYFELLLLFFIAPYIKTGKNLKKVGIIAVSLSAFFLTLVTLAFQLVFPYSVGTEFFLPVYQLARLINYGRFFQRIESIFILIWAATAFLYLTIGFLFSLLTLQKAFKLKYYKPLILPGAVLLFTISLLPTSLLSELAIVIPIFRNYSWIIPFGLTGLLLGLAVLKKGREKVSRKREAR
jgi:spore germination protein KB